MSRTSRLIIAIAAVFFLRCNGNNPVDMQGPDSCQAQIDNLDAALNTYKADVNSRDKCIAVKNAGAALLDCPYLSPGDKTNYKNTIDAIFCN